MLPKKLKFALAFFKLISDPTKTGAVFDLAESGVEGSPGLKHALAMAKKISGFSTQLAERYVPPTLDLARLLELPPSTLGHQYATFMTKNSLDPNYYRTPKGSSEGAYLMLRARQTHDFWHVALGLSSDEADEFALQAFYLGQFEPPLSSIILAAAFLRVSSRTPERISQFMERMIQNYQLGRRAKPFLGMKWEERLTEDLGKVRQELGLAQG